MLTNRDAHTCTYIIEPTTTNTKKGKCSQIEVFTLAQIELTATNTEKEKSSQTI